MPNFRAIGLFSGEFNMKNITNSDWKAIPGFPKYAITPDGQVWSYKRNRFLKPSPNDQGYLVVRLSNDLGPANCRIHRLVGMAFIPLPPEFNNDYSAATINHKDHNKTNNHYTNLEWVTHEYNIQEAWDNGYCNHKKKPCFCVSIEDKTFTDFDSARDIDRHLNLSKCATSKAINEASGIIQGKYIVGYTENLDQSYLSPVPDVDGIIQLYSDIVDNFTPHRKECFCIDSLDNTYHEFGSTRDIDRELNLPRGAVRNDIHRNHGLIRGRYIVGYLNDPRWKGVPANPTIEQIVGSYADQIELYKSRNIGPKKITNLQTGESKIYNSLSEFAREHGLDPKHAGQYLRNHSDLYRVELA